MKVVLSSNPYRDKGLRVALEAQRILDKAGAETVLCLPFTPKKGDRFDMPKHLKLGKLETELPGADILICFGGDGTILHAARDATIHNVPVMGVNMGSVGFMAELERGELSLLTRLAQGDYRTETRMMLHIRVYRGEKLIMEDIALNDAVISKGSIARVAELEVRADDVLVTTITGDGIIVASPAGSTAYSMSAGGPIVEPGANLIVLTPICAHTLNARSIILRSEDVVDIVIDHGRDGSKLTVEASFDANDKTSMVTGDSIRISKSERTTTIIKLDERSFIEALHRKMNE